MGSFVFIFGLHSTTILFTQKTPAPVSALQVYYEKSSFYSLFKFLFPYGDFQWDRLSQS